MKKNRTCRLRHWLLCLGMFGLPFLSMSVNLADSIDVLSHLAMCNDQRPEKVGYLKQKYELALKIDSFPAVYDALLDLAIYCYNQGNERDSILYWEKKIDSITTARNEYPNALFMVKSVSGKDLIIRGDYEMAMSGFLKLYQLATDKNQTYGLICSLECLGQIYQEVARDSDAVAVFQESLDLLDNYESGGDILRELSESEKIKTQLRILSMQLESACSSYQLQMADAIAMRYKELIEKQEQASDTEESKYSIRHEYWRLYSLCLELYSLNNQLDKAAEMLKKVDEYGGCSYTEVDYVIRLDLFSRALYYYKCGNYSQALQYIDKSLSVSRMPRELSLKAKILKKQDRLDEVLALYDEIYRCGAQNNDATFMRQINQLRTLHEINNSEMQERQLAQSSRLMQQKQKQLVFSCLVVGLLLFLLYILYIYIRRAQRLSDELQLEKLSLQQSEQKLRQEMKRAQDASQMKSTFVANMSHEIRTPLNAIVGFSGLLLDESTTTDERVEYAAVIKNNTQLLLNLVDDVLDLSNMETGDLHFEFQYCPLLTCCNNALDSVRTRITDGVKLTFTPSEEQVVLYTDNMRLQQLLTNLLTNSIKFTPEGEINLTYELDEEHHQVHITVTDTGFGIPPEKQDAIFKRFEKLDEYKPGTGLGLSICRIIAERLGGCLVIDSTYTTGARFIFTHPC